VDVRQRVRAVLDGEMPDRIPQLIYPNFLPRGSLERKLRNMGLGLNLHCSVHSTESPNVKQDSRTEGDNEATDIITPMGNLRSRRRINMTFQHPGGSWRVEYPAKGVEDLEILNFTVEDMSYQPHYDDYLRMDSELGGDGVISVGACRTPLMHLIVYHLGYRVFSRMLHRHRQDLEETIEIVDRSFTEICRIVAESPAEIVWIPDNIDEVLMPPHLFERYCLPYYEKYTDILHKGGKKVISHMDGRLKALKALVGRTKLDAIEAFTPPPMGNLPISEAREAWKGKALWLNFPQVIFLESRERIRAFTLELMEEMGDGSGYILGMTEDIHPDHYRKGMETLTSTLYEKGRLPLVRPLGP
jgi:uroporphyrinogen-III decarboxylase